MERIGIFYATREGQSHKVADHLAAALLARGLSVSVHDVRDGEAAEALARSQAVVVIGSVHMGKHEPELVTFVNANHAKLDATPPAFLSVCGAESGAEQAATLDARAAAAKHVAEQLEAFEKATAWHPARVVPIAGALRYTHYNPLVRWVMKRISRSEAMPTDTSRDYEFTNWGALDEVARQLAEEMHASP
ncbi:MAG TPA: flavodoxin domain-containing protein [Polyangiaceae bacterium]|jgi:menaquinone-dependent protoporphyrinogen oxidase